MECFVIGNGPSLVNIPNKWLDILPTFGTNRIYLKYIPTYYACINSLIAEQSRFVLDRLNREKYITNRVPIKDAFPLFSTESSFSFHPLEGICEGSTVTFVALQLAFWKRFRRVYLVGVDHFYKTPGAPNREIKWKGADINHFSPDYMQSGEKWNLPDLSASEVFYQQAREVFEDHGGRIINVSNVSKLEIFEKMSLKSFEEMINERKLATGYTE